MCGGAAASRGTGASYAVGHAALRREGRWLAAVLACGAGAALSHRTAAALCDLRPADAARIDVTAALRGPGPAAGASSLHETRAADAARGHCRTAASR